MNSNAKIEGFWRRYVDSLPNAEDAVRRFYEVMRVGESDASATQGAALIQRVVKTTTSSLLWQYQAANKPRRRPDTT